MTGFQLMGTGFLAGRQWRHAGFGFTAALVAANNAAGGRGPEHPEAERRFTILLSGTPTSNQQVADAQTYRHQACQHHRHDHGRYRQYLRDPESGGGAADAIIQLSGRRQSGPSASGGRWMPRRPLAGSRCSWGAGSTIDDFVAVPRRPVCQCPRKRERRELPAALPTTPPASRSIR